MRGLLDTKQLLLVVQTFVIAYLLYFTMSSLLARYYSSRVEFRAQRSVKKTKLKNLIGAIIGGSAGTIVAQSVIYSDAVWAKVTVIVLSTYIGWEMVNEMEKKEKQRLKEKMFTLSFLFELGIKSGIPIDRILYICAQIFDKPKYKSIFERASAMYKKSNDVTETFSYLEGEIGIEDIKMLASAVAEVDRLGGGVKSLETLSRMQTMQEVETITRKANSVGTSVTFATAFILFMMITIYFLPYFQSIMDTMMNIFK